MFLLVFTNSGLAARKGKNPFVWGIITLVAFIVAYVLMSTLYVFFTYKGALTPENIDDLRTYMESFQRDTIKVLLLAMFGVGGALLVRYRLTRYPDKPIRREEDSEEG